MGYQTDGLLWLLPEDAKQDLWVEYVSTMRDLYVAFGEFQMRLSDADMTLSALLFGDDFILG